ncbi:MAG TPA: DUF3344 domain-containing protein [Methanoregulaceae archaeon]|nr:DUF3344 domain-containing protein [Methanoregulaceae archaeon]HQJ88356.1 DUF3344 domain-containing protein [Methanoregulaceae archaeon]
MTSCCSSTGSRRCACALVILLLLLTTPAGAVYSMNGIPLKVVAHGQHHGSVSVTGGHGLVASPYTQSFTVPSGTVRFARLYVGVWGGTPNYTGTVETSFNGVSLGERPLEGGRDTNSLTYVSGFGVHWCAYDVQDRVVPGANSATATTAGEIDGRVYGIVLAVATEDPSAPEIEYWFAEGNENLNKDAAKNTVDLPLGPGPSAAEVTDARLHVAYLASVRGDGDQVLFNGRTLATDAAGASGGAYFDLRSYDVRSLAGSSNTVGFVRGNANRLHPCLVAYVCTRRPATTAPTTVLTTTVQTTQTTVAVTSTTPVSPTEVSLPSPRTAVAPTPPAEPGGTLPIAGPGQGMGGPVPEPTDTAGILLPPESGPGPGIPAPGGGGAEPGTTGGAVGSAVAIVLFTLILGAGVIVASVFIGAGLRCYRRLSRKGTGEVRDGGLQADKTGGAVDPVGRPATAWRYGDDD